MLPQQLLPRKVRRPQLTHIVAFAKERSEWIFQPSTIQPGDPHWTRLGQFGESTFSIAIAGLDELRRESVGHSLLSPSHKQRVH